MEQVKKFLASRFGVFTILCIVAAVMIAGVQNALVGVLIYAVLSIIFYPVFSVIQSFSNRRILFLACPFSLIGIYFLYLLFSIPDHQFRLLNCVIVLHLMARAAITIYSGIKRYRNRELYSERRDSEDISAWTEEDEYSPAISIAEGFCGMLEKRGLQRFLMRDFTTSTFLSYGDFADRDITQKKLQDLLLDILRFLELPDVVALVIEYVSASGTQTSQAGSYSRTHYLRTITLKLRDFYGPNNAVAILCHECTHYFMEYNRLNWNDTDLNEQRTDIVANLIGFNRIMMDGYRSIDTVTVSGNTRTTATHTIGYITMKDCEDLGRFLMHIRRNLEDKQAAKQHAADLRQEFMQHLETAKTLVFQLEHIDFNRMDSTSPEHVAKIQRVLMEKEARNIPAELNRFEKCIAGNPELPQLEREAESLSKLCTDLVLWQQVLQGR